MASEWYDEFHRDMRRYKVFRAFESTKRWMSKRSTMPNVSIRACGGEQGGLVAGLQGIVDRLTVGWLTGWRGRSGAGAEHAAGNDTFDDAHGQESAGTGSGENITDDHNGEDRENSRDDPRGDDAYQESSFLFPGESQDTTSESLRAEALWRRKAVQDAVLDAEAAELEDQEKFRETHGHHGRDGHDSEPHVPSIIRPGNYGGGDDQRQDASFGRPSSATKGGAWKRFMYPAGRIMHFVPAHVVPGFALMLSCYLYLVSRTELSLTLSSAMMYQVRGQCCFRRRTLHRLTP